ncbi:hypothetical protein EST38_g7867 [Candolleomyces aberdarensis]|uniref:Uncharacterized protein n=1 Tax=Candolleomyces aberdarensis TaxID=2316362 RepID=A0A4Q2DG81_9AGAR|nr:hypothetical protein EST38_g7867 [Candolleomyces aberdarensis]
MGMGKPDQIRETPTQHSGSVNSVPPKISQSTEVLSNPAAGLASNATIVGAKKEESKSDPGAVQPGTEEWDWPDGDVDRRCIDGTPEAKTLNQTKWVWRSKAGGKLTKAEEAAIDEQVSKNPGATPPQLRTGTGGLQSVPLHEISDTLANPRAARYQVAKSQDRLGIATPASSKSGFATFSALQEVKDKNGKAFIIGDSLIGDQYLMFQNDFMKQVLQEAIEEWGKQGSESEGRHGMVTDGSHSFFRQGVLLSTCVFSTRLAAWVPVLYTWIGGESAEHFRPHFRYLSQFIVDTMGSEFREEFLAHVMDYSAAQKKAHDAEFVEAVVKFMGPLFAKLSPAAQAAEREAISQQSQRARLGCNMHFLASVTRIRDTVSLIPSEHVPQFMSFIKTMMGNDTTEPEFDNAVAGLSRDFPAIRGWLKWWTQPWVMSMAFPAKSQVLQHVRKKLPTTTNATEHHHHLLNHAATSDQELLPGIWAILRHMQELQAQYNAIKNGVFNPPAPKKPPHRKKKKPYENDGRAPDTVARLQAIEPSAPAQEDLMSYKWLAPNSCFIDHTVELWYRAWRQWPVEEREDLRSLLPADSFLSFLTSHFACRSRLVLEEKRTKNTQEKITRELALGQMKIKSLIFDQWKIALPGEYFCAVGWLQRGVQDPGTPVSAQARFGIHQLFRRQCPQGHVMLTYEPSQPRIVTHIELSLIAVLRELYPNTVLTPEHYFAHRIPRDDTSRPVFGPGVSVEAPQNFKCSDPTCQGSAELQDIQFSWPRILTCSLKGQAATLSKDSFYQDVLEWPETFSIQDLNGEAPVVYELVGHLIYSGSHYTCQIRIEGENYAYNDIDGTSEAYALLRPASTVPGPASLQPAGYVYNRVSAKSTVRIFG